ncbi:tyrosine-type recombinase/integrase [Deinococcus grandis]|nr:tyrosine-type recombinase/integrase [Deinococcus grandis]
MTTPDPASSVAPLSPSPSGSMAMMLYKANLQARAWTWADLEPDELRRRAIQAARDREALWGLTEAHLLLNGLAGARVSAHTVRAYHKGILTFLDFAEKHGVQLLRPRANHGVAYVRWLEGQKLSTSSVRTRLAAARKLFSALRWADASSATPFADVRPAPDPVPRTEKRRPYTDEEIALLVRTGDTEEKVILLLGAHAGLRVSEICSLQRQDVHLDAQPPHLIITGKRQKRQSVPLSRSLSQALQAWLAGTPSLGPQVIAGKSSDYVQNRVKRVCERAGVRYERRQVHGLRHSAGTRVYTDTGDLLAVRDHLRHADITSSEIYVEYSRKQKPSAVRNW